MVGANLFPIVAYCVVLFISREERKFVQTKLTCYTKHTYFIVVYDSYTGCTQVGYITMTGTSSINSFHLTEVMRVATDSDVTMANDFH
jgi:hypothetical protein